MHIKKTPWMVVFLLMVGATGLVVANAPTTAIFLALPKSAYLRLPKSCMEPTFLLVQTLTPNPFIKKTTKKVVFFINGRAIGIKRTNSILF